MVLSYSIIPQPTGKTAPGDGYWNLGGNCEKERVLHVVVKCLLTCCWISHQGAKAQSGETGKPDAAWPLWEWRPPARSEERGAAAAPAGAAREGDVVTDAASCPPPPPTRYRHEEIPKTQWEKFDSGGKNRYVGETSLQNYQYQKDKEELRKIFRLKASRDTWQLTGIPGHRLDAGIHLGREKTLTQDTGPSDKTGRGGPSRWRHSWGNGVKPLTALTP